MNGAAGQNPPGNPGKENPSARQKREKGAEAEVFRGILYGFDPKARDGQLDRIIGRDEEIYG